MTYVIFIARTDEDNVGSKYKRRKDVISTSHIITALKVSRLSDSTKKITEFMRRVSLPYFHWDCKVSDVTSSV